MSTPSISVMMSVFNGEKWIGDSVDSILSQKEKNFEFIIIDDGSTDTTSTILKSYKDKKIVVVSQDNMGLTKSLNIGLALAKGEFVARIDADDISMPDRLEKQKRFVLHNPEIVLVGSNAILIDEEGQRVGRADYPTSHEMLVERLTMRFQSVFPHSSIFFRRDVVMREGGYNENYTRSQDYELYLRLSRTYRIANINEYLVKLRLNMSGPTYNDDNQLIMGLAALISHYRRQAGMPDDSGMDSASWNSYLNLIRVWVSEKGWLENLHSKRNFRRCRTLFRQKDYVQAFQTLLRSFCEDPAFLFRRTLPINIPADIQHFVTR